MHVRLLRWQRVRGLNSAREGQPMTRTNADRRATQARAAYVEAGLAYALATEEAGGSCLEPLVLGARMRLAAKAMLSAKRLADESRGLPVPARRCQAGVAPIVHDVPGECPPRADDGASGA
jgi:hypothetical protein